MSLGPVQLIVVGFNEPDFHGEIIAELERLKASDTVRVIDSLAIYKTADGELEVEHLSNLSHDEAIEVGSTIAALLGVDIEGEEASAAAEVLSEEEAWDVVEDIPADSAAALVLIEHRWAIPLRDAVARAGGFRVGDAFVSPLDLAEIGLLSIEDARAHHAMETAPARAAN